MPSSVSHPVVSPNEFAVNSAQSFHHCQVVTEEPLSLHFCEREGLFNTHTHTLNNVTTTLKQFSPMGGGEGPEDTDLCCTQVLYRALRNDNGGFIFITVRNHNLFLEVKANRADYCFRLCMNM